MYSQRMKQYALATLVKNQMNIQKTIAELGYPRKTILYRWSEALPRRIPQRNCTIQEKPKAVQRCFEQGESPGEVAKEMGLSGGRTICGWQRAGLEKGDVTRVKKKKDEASHARLIEAPQQPTETPGTYDALKAEYEALKAQNNAYLEERKRLVADRQQVAMERDVLEKTIEILKKDLGVNPEAMSNLEKAVIVDALRDRYSRPILRNHLGLPKSSYHYAKIAAKTEGKHGEVRKAVRSIFEINDAAYGSDRIWGELRRSGIRISEKIVRRLMKEEGLRAACKKRRPYSSYQGEATPAPENLIERDFHADKANEKWLTDITEFSIPAGKVYLSPIVDCYDGMVVAWTMSTKPDGELVNKSLEKAIGTLDGETPIVHSDRGGHYRWPGWIDLMTNHNLIRSMSRKGCSPDNAACEGFFGRLKNERFYDRSFGNMSTNDFMKYIDTSIQWYNTTRIKKSLGYLSPMEYRQRQQQAA